MQNSCITKSNRRRGSPELRTRVSGPVPGAEPWSRHVRWPAKSKAKLATAGAVCTPDSILVSSEIYSYLAYITRQPGRLFQKSFTGHPRSEKSRNGSGNLIQLESLNWDGRKQGPKVRRGGAATKRLRRTLTSEHPEVVGGSWGRMTLAGAPNQHPAFGLRSGQDKHANYFGRQFREPLPEKRHTRDEP